MTEKPSLFISYSHKDEDPWKTFVTSHLKVAERQGDFTIWDDRQIRGGGEWRAEIEAALASADIAIILISRHFLTSDFIMNHEAQAALRRMADDDMKIYPILISACTWKSVDWLARLNMRPTDGTPLNSFDDADRDHVMTKLAAEIASILHPNEAGEQGDQQLVRGLASPSSMGEQPRLSAWWRAASIEVRATVLGTVFGLLALVWGVLSSLLPDAPDCNATAETGGVVVCDDVHGDIQTSAGSSEEAK